MNAKGHQISTSKPSFHSENMFNENLVAVYEIKEALMLNKPAYVGMCILHWNKTLMHDFHYSYVRNRYDNKAKLLFRDSDVFQETLIN